MDVLRTDDARFDGLPDFDFAPHYVEVDDTEGRTLRVHFLDEGPRDGEVVLVMHGEPTWSYLYRHMIPVFVAAGHRVLAPDLVGFGRSDKPVAQSDYTYQRHVDWMSDWLRQVDATGITLVCQDWGGLIGLRLLAAMPERFRRLVVANTALPTGDQPMSDAFKAWRDFSQTVDPFDAGRIVFGGTETKLTEAEVAAYNAPFPDESHKAGARMFPMLVPDSPDDPAAEPNRAAWRVLAGLELPVLTAFGAQDRVMAGVEKVFQRMMPGAAGQDHVIFDGAGHFLQEDVGEELARAAVAFMAANG
ncbi:haloalkane dehalogenase [uncultured Tateyamaria sp.]|uniref:haloalkane dehalogenase n=1 Tax=uncultured Tateyamaria sp. TaxID=455651 RepID=UPI002610F49C|nr:haloalkane dehalogenase [uncultured Tateyamaria sp.]